MLEMLEFDITTFIIRFGFCAACLTNSFLIYLTVARVTYIKGTYKYMIIIFASTCVVFDAFEVLSRPSLHNFDGSLMYFSENGNLDGNQNLIYFYKIFILLYAGLYSNLIAFVGVQFIFRYSTILGYSGLLKSFNGFRRLFWLPVVIIPGVMFAGLGAILMQPDEYSDEYVRAEVRMVYSKNIEDVPRLLMVPYDAQKNIRWNNLMFSISGITIMTLEYSVIIFCAINMHLNITEKLKNCSFRHRKLENQFFKALLIQITLPTFFLTLPILPVLLLPVLDIKITFHSNAFYSALALYPSMDSIAMMLIVSEYRTCLKALVSRRLIGSDGKEDSSFTTPAAVIGRGAETPI